MPKKINDAVAEAAESAEKAPVKAKSSPAPKKAAAPKKKAAEKTAPVEEVIIQSGGSEWNLSALKETAIAAYTAEGHRRGRISKLTLYVKPEDRKVYYVVNDKNTGSVDFE